MLRFMSGVMQFSSERGYIVDFLGIFVNQGYLRALLKLHRHRNPEAVAGLQVRIHRIYFVPRMFHIYLP